jgi:hypothetical protein
VQDPDSPTAACATSRNPPLLAGHSSARLPELPPIVAGKHGRRTAARSPLCILGCAGISSSMHNFQDTCRPNHLLLKAFYNMPARNWIFRTNFFPWKFRRSLEFLDLTQKMTVHPLLSARGQPNCTPSKQDRSYS